MTDTIPDYAFGPIKRSVDSLITAHELLHISMRGIGVVCNFPKMDQRLIDLTIEVGKEVTDELKGRLQESKRLASFAESESKQGFPFLHAFATVAAWGTLEVAVEDMLLGILLNEPKALGKEEILKDPCTSGQVRRVR